jgi:hypothetical protein
MRCAVPLRKLGEFQLKGFAAPQSVFATVPITMLTQPS